MIPFTYYSPLRYPGGKGKISEFIKLLLEENLLLDGNYVELYAGGASVAIDLLINEYVSEIHINDIDTSIYAFWYSILNETERFCEKIESIDVNIKTWQEQKEIQKHSHRYPLFDVGFSTFYLNRTNRSGIISGGVIGGLKQNGKWKIDARFTKDNLIERIRKIADYKENIRLYNEDALKLINFLAKFLPKKTFLYLDPPYYKKGKDLYVNYYKHWDHVLIADTITSLKLKYWLISYDNTPQIKLLYENFRKQSYSLNYSAAASPTKGSEVLIFSSKLSVPEIKNPTSRNEIKNYYYNNFAVS